MRRENALKKPRTRAREKMIRSEESRAKVS